ncbi:hypothetical protein PITCH_A1540003 [uncultured Desulfobacterium sp.]|uniref:Uncharacterized protein n=1 Tax=uncultured Desulfobacterium sp. TaxID=201089 RepID=A0A445MTP0_9BACT|nr:hypothetical protein PITCH_A1540003 [uncultured Desulfobacterium sp.]
MEITIEKEGKGFAVTIINGNDKQSATFKTEAEAEAYKNFMSNLVKKPKAKRITRLQASIAAFKLMNEEGFILKQLATKANGLYMADGGKDNIKEQENNANWLMVILRELGAGYVVPAINIKPIENV